MITSDAGLLAYREFDDALGLMAIAEQHLVDGRTGRNGRHDLVGILRQSVFGFAFGRASIAGKVDSTHAATSQRSKHAIRSNNKPAPVTVQ